MKVLILTEGGRDTGFGHTARCLSLYQAFEEKKISFDFLVNGDESIKDLLKGVKYKIFNWLKEKDRLFKITKNMDIVIIDSYLADMSFYNKISESVKAPVYFDDTKRLDYPRGVVVNGSVYAERIDYPEKNRVRYLLGTEYMPLRRAFWKIPKKHIRKKMRDILITFGGMNHSDLAKKTLKYLSKEFPDFTYHIISPSPGLLGRRLYGSSARIYNNLSAHDFISLMLKCDIAISAGGHTLYEMARIGIPVAGICLAENQERNLNGWQKAGFLMYAGQENDAVLLKRLTAAINNLIPYNERFEKSNLGREYIDGKGAKRIINNLIRDEN